MKRKVKVKVQVYILILGENDEREDLGVLAAEDHPKFAIVRECKTLTRLGGESIVLVTAFKIHIKAMIILKL